MVAADESLRLTFDQSQADALLAAAGEAGKGHRRQAVDADRHLFLRRLRRRPPTPCAADDKTAKPIEIKRDGSLPSSKVDAFFKNPFADLAAARQAPLKIENALITPVPSTRSGWITACFIFAFMAFFAVGPGVCVWLALSELMPTRIRSNGMSIALLINQAVSTTIAAIFLPTVGKYGYGTMFFAFAGATRHLLRHRHVLPARNQGQDAGRDRIAFQSCLERSRLIAGFGQCGPT